MQSAPKSSGKPAAPSGAPLIVAVLILLALIAAGAAMVVTTASADPWESATVSIF